MENAGKIKKGKLCRNPKFSNNNLSSEIRLFLFRFELFFIANCMLWLRMRILAWNLINTFCCALASKTGFLQPASHFFFSAFFSIAHNIDRETPPLERWWLILIKVYLVFRTVAANLHLYASTREVIPWIFHDMHSMRMGEFRLWSSLFFANKSKAIINIYFAVRASNFWNARTCTWVEASPIAV